MYEPTQEEISKRAYEIWIRHGRASGRDEQNWLEAVEELYRQQRASIITFNVKPTRKRKPSQT
jgi:hypothetical protein